VSLHSTIRRILNEETQKPKILEFPSLDFFNNNPFEAWKIIQKIIEKKGNPPYSIRGALDLINTTIKSLGNLKSVGGYLDLRHTDIESLGNLKSVARNLDLRGTPLSKMYIKKQIREMVNVGGEIYF
jgi:hypothetical protein